MGVGTSSDLEALYMVVLGMGLGCVMQVLVLLVQNAVPYTELGVATSAATFFRLIGGSFGTAIFGAIFSNVLIGNLVRHLGVSKLPSGVSSSGITPALLDKLPSAVHHGFAAAYAESIQTVFVIAAPVAVLAFLASWFIPHVALRRTMDASPDTPTDGATNAPLSPLEPEPSQPLLPATNRAIRTEL
jgi:hypothetical protein